MSSHHIVKEDQEPALIIAEVDNIPLSLLNQLLEWNPIVITDAYNLKPVTQIGFKVDVIVANEPVDPPQDHTLILPMTTSFLDTSLAYLIKRGCRVANIISPYTKPTALLRYATEIQTVLLGNGKRVFVVKSGFTKWKSKGETVLIYGNRVPDVKGLQPTEKIYTGEREYITVADGFYSIQFDEPYGLVGEPL